MRLGAALVLVVAVALYAIAPGAHAQTDDDDAWRYRSDRYDPIREIRYWAAAEVGIGDYRGDRDRKDAEYLGLLVRNPVKDEVPWIVSADLRAHFFTEFRRLFGDLPFYDWRPGWKERWDAFYRDHREPRDTFSQRFEASEHARRRAMYPGRAGALGCAINIGRRTFPVLYTISCEISAAEDLHVFHRPWATPGKDLGYSSPGHIAGELRRAITDMLTEKHVELGKIRRYGKRP